MHGVLDFMYGVQKKQAEVKSYVRCILKCSLANTILQALKGKIPNTIPQLFAKYVNLETQNTDTFLYLPLHKTP